MPAIPRRDVREAFTCSFRWPHLPGQELTALDYRPEDLQVEERFLDSSTPHPEVFPTSARHAVTNVHGQYS